jgi:hypothetical protein
MDEITVMDDVIPCVIVVGPFQRNGSIVVDGSGYLNYLCFGDLPPQICAEKSKENPCKHTQCTLHVFQIYGLFQKWDCFVDSVCMNIIEIAYFRIQIRNETV